MTAGPFPDIVYSLILGDVDKEKDNYGDTWIWGQTGCSKKGHLIQSGGSKTTFLKDRLSSLSAEPRERVET